MLSWGETHTKFHASYMLTLEELGWIGILGKSLHTFLEDSAMTTSSSVKIGIRRLFTLTWSNRSWETPSFDLYRKVRICQNVLRYRRGHLRPQRGAHHLGRVLREPAKHASGRAGHRLPVHPDGAEDPPLHHDPHHWVPEGVHEPGGAHLSHRGSAGREKSFLMFGLFNSKYILMKVMIIHMNYFPVAHVSLRNHFWPMK